MEPTYPWYTVVNDATLEQGDFFFSCPVVEPSARMESLTPGSKSDTEVEIGEYDLLVLSQSCDLAFGKLETVLMCPHWPLDQYGKREQYFNSKKGKEEIRRGNVPGLHMLQECELQNFAGPLRVVNFRQVLGLPFDYVSDLAQTQTPRLRLLPPYREHLAQAFARFIMRVGLPVDIPPFR